jgi:hypothetical protein
MFPAPEWFKESLTFSLHRMEKEAGWGALKMHHPDVTSVYSFFRCDLLPRKGLGTPTQNELSGQRANVVLHAITMASHEVGTDKFRFGGRRECDASRECLAVSYLDIGWRIGQKVDGGSFGDACEGKKLMVNLQSECWVEQQHGDDAFWLLTGVAVRFAQKCKLCVHVTVPRQDTTGGGADMQLEKAVVHLIVKKRQEGTYAQNVFSHVKQFDSVSYNHTGVGDSQVKPEAAAVLMHFGQMVGFVNPPESVKVEFRRQEAWLNQMTAGDSRAVPIWQYGTLGRTKINEEISAMFRFDNTQSRFPFALDKDLEPDLRDALRRASRRAEEAEDKLADLQKRHDVLKKELQTANASGRSMIFLSFV